jgi:hypothetical protein
MFNQLNVIMLNVAAPPLQLLLCSDKWSVLALLLALHTLTTNSLNLWISPLFIYLSVPPLNGS